MPSASSWRSRCVIGSIDRFRIGGQAPGPETTRAAAVPVIALQPCAGRRFEGMVIGTRSRRCRVDALGAFAARGGKTFPASDPFPARGKDARRTEFFEAERAIFSTKIGRGRNCSIGSRHRMMRVDECLPNLRPRLGGFLSGLCSGVLGAKLRVGRARQSCKPAATHGCPRGVSYLPSPGISRVRV